MGKMNWKKEPGHENLGSSQPIQMTKDAKTKRPLKEGEKKTRKKKKTTTTRVAVKLFAETFERSNDQCSVIKV